MIAAPPFPEYSRRNHQTAPTFPFPPWKSASNTAPSEATSPGPPVWRPRSRSALPTRRFSWFHREGDASKSFATESRSSRSRRSGVTPGKAKSYHY